jgi:response regulator RpfG family c-di-GMP phosphodiesterase
MNEKARVLYVDDERPNLTSFKMLFQDNYDIHIAESASAGLELMREHEIDIVISDQRMPEMTGVEMLKRVRSEFPQAFRIIVTGFADIEAVVDSINEGHVYHFFSKPWDEQKVQNVIDRALEIMKSEKNK